MVQFPSFRTMGQFIFRKDCGCDHNDEPLFFTKDRAYPWPYGQVSNFKMISISQVAIKSLW
jgi:hypothetical protein